LRLVFNRKIAKHTLQSDKKFTLKSLSFKPFSSLRSDCAPSARFEYLIKSVKARAPGGTKALGLFINPGRADETHWRRAAYSEDFRPGTGERQKRQPQG
jgi:hypothetical protein